MEDPARKDLAEKLRQKARQAQKDLDRLSKEIDELLEKIKQIPNDPEAKKK